MIIRFVGYRTPAAEEGNLTRLASAAKAPAPAFARTTADLAATLRRLVIPKPREALPVEIPTPAPRAYFGTSGLAVVPVYGPTGVALSADASPVGYRNPTVISGPPKCPTPEENPAGRRLSAYGPGTPNGRATA